MDWRNQEGVSRSIVINQVAIMFIDTVAIIYYAIVAEPITTVAHILAITVLGIPLYLMNHRHPPATEAHILNASDATRLIDSK